MKQEYLDSIGKNISSRLSLRKPQVRSLEILSNLISNIKLDKNRNVNDILKEIIELYPSVESFEREFPSVCFALATGVGKTRLMGAFISYLFLKGVSRHYFILAPNLTIYQKLKEDFNPKNEKYVFKGMQEIASNEPEIITGEDYDTGRGVRNENLSKGSQTTIYNNESRIFINIFNIDKINAKDNKKSKSKLPKVKRIQEYLGQSYFDYLSKLPDLIVFMDEAHRYHGTAGAKAINDLNPLFGIELTATPKIVNSNLKLKNIIYEYDLASAMEDGYVKEPAVATLKDFDIDKFPTDLLEKQKITDALTYHESTKIRLEIYSKKENKKKVKPFILIVCKDTTHANEIYNFLNSKEFLNGKYINKIAVIHSNLKGEESDENIKKLTSIEKYDEPTEILIHVNKLKEGWDVSNLFTIVPLRASASEILTEQTLGRGLRLPYGRRTGEELIDTLTIIAHDRFQEIVDNAHKEGSLIKKRIEISSSGEIIFDHQKSIESRPIYNHVDQDSYLSNALQEVIRDENFESLPSSNELSKDKNIKSIISFVEDKLNKKLDNNELEFIKSNIKSLPQLSIDIPSIVLTPNEKVDYGFKDFNLKDLEKFHLEPVEKELLIKNLRTNKSIHLNKLENNNEILKEKDFPSFIVEHLSEISLIDYQEHSDLLFKISNQFIKRLKSYLKSEKEIENVLLYHTQQIVDFLFVQIKKHRWETSTTYKVIVNKGFSILQNKYFKIDHNDSIRNFRSIPEDKNNIKKMVFNGFNKCCYDNQKFDSVDGELRFAHTLEDSVLVKKWFKNYNKLLHIEYGENNFYNPDFIIETEKLKFLCEIKRSSDVSNEEVILKKNAAILWCKNASKNSSIPWKYLFIPHDEIKTNISFKKLTDDFTEK